MSGTKPPPSCTTRSSTRASSSPRSCRLIRALCAAPRRTLLGDFTTEMNCVKYGIIIRGVDNGQSQGFKKCVQKVCNVLIENDLRWSGLGGAGRGLFSGVPPSLSSLLSSSGALRGTLALVPLAAAAAGAFRFSANPLPGGGRRPENTELFSTACSKYNYALINVNRITFMCGVITTSD